MSENPEEVLSYIQAMYYPDMTIDQFAKALGTNSNTIRQIKAGAAHSSRAKVVAALGKNTEIDRGLIRELNRALYARPASSEVLHEKVNAYGDDIQDIKQALKNIEAKLGSKKDDETPFKNNTLKVS